jgi:hypothetical protein
MKKYILLILISLISLASFSQRYIIPNSADTNTVVTYHGDRVYTTVAGAPVNCGIVTDCEFPDNTNWTEGTGWLIGGEVATFTDGGSSGDLTQALGDMVEGFITNTTYDYSFYLNILSGTTANFEVRRLTTDDALTGGSFSETTSGLKTGTMSTPGWGATPQGLKVAASTSGDANYSITDFSLIKQ